MLPSRETLTSWRKRLTGTSWGLTKSSAKSSMWGRTTPGTSTEAGKQLSKKSGCHGGCPGGTLKMSHQCALDKTTANSVQGSTTERIARFSTQHWWDTPGRLGQILHSPVQKGYGYTSERPVRGLEDDWGTEASLLWGKAEKAGTTELGEGSE